MFDYVCIRTETDDLQLLFGSHFSSKTDPLDFVKARILKL